MKRFGTIVIILGFVIVGLAFFERYVVRVHINIPFFSDYVLAAGGLLSIIGVLIRTTAGRPTDYAAWTHGVGNEGVGQGDGRFSGGVRAGGDQGGSPGRSNS